MASAVLEEKGAESLAPGPDVVNDFSIHVATANGSGSRSSNNILMRSIFQMGIPVSGKNLFPSNIQGLPTWFTIRASKEGYIARRRDIGVLICMNPETAQEDVKTVTPGAAVIYEETLEARRTRDDVHFYPGAVLEARARAVHDGEAAPAARQHDLRRRRSPGCSASRWPRSRRRVAKQFKSKAKAVEINQRRRPGAASSGRRTSRRRIRSGSSA